MLGAFLVVFFVLAKFGFPAIIGMVEKRKNYIDESLRKAPALRISSRRANPFYRKHATSRLSFLRRQPPRATQ